jgi:hypothetical protein
MAVGVRLGRGALFGRFEGGLEFLVLREKFDGLCVLFYSSVIVAFRVQGIAPVVAARAPSAVEVVKCGRAPMAGE